MKRDSKRPLVESCADASGVAQMDDSLAVGFDRLKIVELSCTTGVGGDDEPREPSSPVCYLSEFEDEQHSTPTHPGIYRN